MLVGAVRAGARPVFNVVHKDRSKGSESKNGDFEVGSQCLQIRIILFK